MYDIGSTKANVDAYLRDKSIRERLKAMSKFVDKGQQNKHIKGTNEYKQYVSKLSKINKFGLSYVEIEETKILELVNKYAGKGILRRNKSGRLLDEVITINDKDIGVCVNDKNGKSVTTSVFKIK